MNHLTRPLLLSLFLALTILPAALRAHCDTREGPVVLAAREALAKGDVTPVLKWVKADDEGEIRTAFARTSAVRQHSATVADLADTWFFETLVRLHRAGEGAPYTGLKAGGPLEPSIAAADHALVSGNVDPVLAETIVPLQAALKARLDRVVALLPHADDSIAAGRAYVEAYVDYVHFAERLATLAAGHALDAPVGHRH